MDRIILKGMEFYGYHGVLKQEQQLGQKFEVDVELELDLQDAGTSDNLAATVSYADVYEVVRQVVTGPPRQLIEAVAEDVAAGVLTNSRVKWVRVRLKKPQAPIAGQFAYMAVEIERGGRS